MYAVFIDKANDQDRKGSGQLRIHSANTVHQCREKQIERERDRDREKQIERETERQKRLKYGNRQRETTRKSQKETKRI